MPRQVDHAARRRQIAEAVFELISEQGTEGATLRLAAARAGVSMGAVQRCFSTKAEMMTFVLEYMNQRVSERVQNRIDASGDPDSAAIMLEQTLIGIVPVDEPSLAETRVWLAFAAQAAVDPALAAIQRRQYADLAALINVLIRAGQGDGDLRADLDPDQEADALITFTDGLNLQILFGRHDSRTALAALEHRLAALRAR
ncbi:MULTISPECIES: TetR/AcrR family transcriptional regulator [Glycomyces]|uniref:AcrR family transcriptional regulator n=2 Tax=Glycomyces TaxID=58113 RepID=A0A9X3PL30_9ACTN|nr:TetR family transcriptional regulator C-terminal domain-containing protein [Glycomyces lechevalierae]MDA1387471.1 TetR family transcriptional regulator C-terminal domain-containing protein [Glycomyces lechevalierae]MDR7338647.1 AcrR family transcriptional regulator [Glycomyces lechevalierae]